MGEYSTARTYQFRVKLSRAGHEALTDRFRAHCRLYNAGLQERRDAYKMAGVSKSFASQNRELTLIRQDDPEWSGEDRRLAIETLRRVDRAFNAFFRRVKAGETPGYPRFKSWRRFRTLEIYAGASRYLRTEGKWTVIRIKGLPVIRLRRHRELPEGQPLNIRITRKPRGVVVSLVYPHENPPVSEELPAAPVGIDVGVTRRITLSTGEYEDGRVIDRRRLRRLQRRVSRARKGSGSRRRKVADLGREWQRVADRARGWEHETSVAIVAAHDFIAVEDLQIDNMVRSAAGTVEEPGVNVSAKQGLNRAILEQGWASLVSKVEYKAASAGIPFVRVPAARTSQTCSECGVVDPASRRSQASFACRHCGYAGHADVNAAVNILRRGLVAVFGPGGAEGEKSLDRGGPQDVEEPRPLGPVSAEFRDSQLALPGFA